MSHCYDLSVATTESVNEGQVVVVELCLAAFARIQWRLLF